MPVLSDFTVVTSGEFLFRRDFTADFGTGGRHDSEALLDIAFLGGARGGDSSMSAEVLLNGTPLRSFTANRWQSHNVIVHDRINLVIPRGRLRSSGNNALAIRPRYESTSDYAFLGTVVVHFHQAS